MQFSHFSLTARDADRVAEFYKSVFGMENRRPPKRLSGPAVWRGNGLPEVDIYSVWLSFPGAPGPFLEIMQYTQMSDRPRPEVNAPGFGHLALTVSDLNQTIERALGLGGELQGRVTNFGSRDQPHFIVYIRDPEGNILEIEQPVRVSL